MHHTNLAKIKPRTIAVET